jgi:transposase
MKAYSIDLRKKIAESLRKGVSKSGETARRFGVNRSTVQRYLKRLDEGALSYQGRLQAKLRSWARAPCNCSRRT